MVVMNKIIEDLNWRYATKKFDASRKLTQDDVHELLEALRLAPSSFGLQPWKFLVVTDAKTREQLREHAFNQPQITEASHLIVLCARTDMDEKHVGRFVESIASTRGIPKESLDEYAQVMVGSVSGRPREHLIEWSKRQVYIAVGFLLSAAAQKRIDACPMEGFDSAKFDEVLGLREKNLTSTVLCALGHRGEDTYSGAKKVRFGREDVMEFR